MTVDIGKFWPLDEDFNEEFWPTLARMRDQCPVVHSTAKDGFWALSSFEDIRKAARDPETFSSAVCVTSVPTAKKEPAVPGMSDAPLHTGLRKALIPWFSPRAVAAIEPVMRAVVQRLIGTVIDRGSCEFMREVAAPFPSRVFFEAVLGLGDRDDLHQLVEWTDETVINPEYAHAAFQAFSQWSEALLRERRQAPPRDDLIASMLAIQVDGKPLDEVLLRGMLMSIIFAGLETVQMALGNIMHHVATEPAVAAQLRGMLGDEERLAAAVEEFLRFEAPAVTITRTTTRTAAVGDCVVPPGERVVMYVASANRDGNAFSNPDELDFSRPILENRHMSFGVGIHRCLGIHLARLELRVALQEILGRLDDIQLAGSPVHFRNGVVTRGPESLQLSFSRIESKKGSVPCESK
jgi:cytochrome P450